MDGIIQQFLATSPQERMQLYSDVRRLIPVAESRQIFGRINQIQSVNDFLNWQEVQSVFKAFHSRCVVSGLNGHDFMLSLERKIDKSG